MLPYNYDFEVPPKLKDQNISRIAKQGTTILVQMDGKAIRFDIEPKWKNTTANFEKQTKGLIAKELKEQITFFLSEQWPNILNGNWNGNGHTTTTSFEEDVSKAEQQREQKRREYQQQQGTFLIDPVRIPDRDYIEFVIKTIKHNVKQEDLLVRLLVYAGLTVYSNNPLCIGIRAPTTQGKTYAVIQSILKFFPKEDYVLIGSMSPKALIRQHGILVDSNNQPLQPTIKDMKREIRNCEDENEREGLQERLDEILLESKYLIDLSGKILIFLESPHPDVWEIINRPE